jgi:hypothetical protein
VLQNGNQRLRHTGNAPYFAGGVLVGMSQPARADGTFLRAPATVLVRVKTEWRR